MSRPQLNMRIDDYYEELIQELIKKTGKDKSKVVRDAIEHHAIYVLGQEEVMNIRLYKHFGHKD